MHQASSQTEMFLPLSNDQCNPVNQKSRGPLLSLLVQVRTSSICTRPTITFSLGPTLLFRYEDRIVQCTVLDEYR